MVNQTNTWIHLTDKTNIYTSMSLALNKVDYNINGKKFQWQVFNLRVGKSVSALPAVAAEFPGKTLSD